MTDGVEETNHTRGTEKSGVMIMDDRGGEPDAVKIVFPESTNLLCQFHIDKNMKAKCKALIGKKNA